MDTGRPNRHLRLFLILLILFYICGTVGLALAKQPQEDEGNFANAAVEFIRNGQLAMPIQTEYVASLDRCVFIGMPLYFMQLGVWSSIFGTSLEILRMDSVLWGLVMVLAWAGILRKLAPDPFSWLAGVALIAGNYDIMNMTASRYDPMAAGLNALGLFCYLQWREQNLTRAVLLANICFALSLMTHPYALFGMMGFGIFFLFLDIRRLSLPLILIAAVPYALALGAYGLYIGRYPAEFREQMAVSSDNRLRYLSDPVEAFRSDAVERYIRLFAGFRPGVPAYMKVKILIVLSWIAGFVGCLLVPSIRGNRRLLALTTYGLVCWLLLVFLEGMRWYIYFIHVIPVYSAVLAMLAGWAYARAGRLRLLVPAALVLFVLYSAATVAFRLRINDFRTVYIATLRYVQSNLQPGDLVMGPAEFAPGLGFREHLLADLRLGYRNGLKPAMVISDQKFRESFAGWRERDPQLHHYVTRMLSEDYEKGYTSPSSSDQYVVYIRKDRSQQPVR